MLVAWGLDTHMIWKVISRHTREDEQELYTERSEEDHKIGVCLEEHRVGTARCVNINTRQSVNTMTRSPVHVCP